MIDKIESDKTEKSQAPKADEMGSRINNQEKVRRVGSSLIFILIGYYIVFIIISATLLFYIISDPVSAENLLRLLGFIACGAVVGSVLYQIRMLYRHYIKSEDFDTKWLGKYISAPWESVALSVVVFSLFQGGGAVLGGSASLNFDEANGFAAFGLGSLVGFGMRDVVGWLGNLVKTMFPAEPNK